MKQAHGRARRLERRITEEMIGRFAAHLRREERAEETIGKYLRAVRAFRAWSGEKEITKDCLAAWKESLRRAGKAAVTINGMLAAVHSILAMLGWEDCRVRYLKVQRRLFRDASRELSREEFGRLVTAARSAGNERLSLLLEAICATGVRVSEVRFLTAEALRRGRAEVTLKGKVRTILLPEKLIRKLDEYCQKEKNLFGRDLRDVERRRDEPRADLGRDERAVRRGGCRGRKGIPTQPAPSVRKGILRALRGHRATGRRAGA